MPNFKTKGYFLMRQKLDLQVEIMVHFCLKADPLAFWLFYLSKIESILIKDLGFLHKFKEDLSFFNHMGHIHT